MTKLKQRHTERDSTPTILMPQLIDIGSRMHVAAVPPDRDTEPVRAFGTCTAIAQFAIGSSVAACERWRWSSPAFIGYLPTKCSSSAD